MKALDNRSLYGEMPQSVQTVVANALQTEVNEMAFRKKRAVATLLAALVLIALACTALAITLGRTQYDAAKAARKAVMEQYGLTPETITLFEEEKSEENGVWTVVFRPWKYNPDAIGTYTVTVEEGKEPVAAWTHDGTAVTGEGLDANVWGPSQLEEVLALERAHYAPGEEFADPYDIFDWLEKAAKRDQMLIDAGLDVFVVNLLPGPDDIPPEEAIATAKRAIREKYGISEESLAQWEIHMMFLKYQDKDEPVYRISSGAVQDNTGSLDVWLYSPSGKIGHCVWSVEPEYRTLPDGSLKGYEEAVKEFIKEGAFAVRPPAEKAEIAARIVEAGYGEYLEGMTYAAPGAEDLGEADALAAAAKALESAYGFTDETLKLFETTASLLLEDGERIWRVAYKPPRDEGILMQHGRYGNDMVGEYSVTLAANDGAVKQTFWSLEAERGDTVYTESTWGQAPAYDARILSWLLKLDEARAAIAAQYGNEQDDLATPWPLEAAAAHDQLFRDAGFDPDVYPNGLPGEGDIPLEEALAAVKQALKDEFQFTDERLKESTYVPSFFVNDPEKPVWCVTIYRIVDGYQDTHVVWVDARTGEIVNTAYMAVGNG